MWLFLEYVGTSIVPFLLYSLISDIENKILTISNLAITIVNEIKMSIILFNLDYTYRFTNINEKEILPIFLIQKSEKIRNGHGNGESPT